MRALTVAVAGFGVAAAAMVLTPLTERGERAGLSVLVVVGLAVTAAALAARRWGAGRAIVALGVVALVTLAAEALGTRTGWPFGEYRYGDALQPELAGVPAVVPLAWFALGLPAREVAARLARRPATRVAVGAACLTAWDLFLDPQMVREGYWRWLEGGSYRGIPLSNYAGWLAVSVVVMAVLEVTLPPRRGELLLVAVYAWVALMQFLGFLLFFDDAVVAVVGGVAMGVPAVAALRPRLPVALR